MVTRPDRRRGRGTAHLAQPGQAGGPRPRPAGDRRPGEVAGGRASSWAWSSPTAGSSRRPCSTPCPWSTCTSRCCPAGGGRPRSSGPSWPATPVTGVCVMAVEEGLDTGPVYAREEVADRRRASTSRLAAPAAGGAWAPPAGRRAGRRGRGLPEPVPQVGEPTYAEKIAARRARAALGPTGRRAGPGGAPGPGLHRRSGAGGCGCSGRGGGRRRPRPVPRRAPGRATWWRPGEGVLRLLAVQPAGEGPMAAARLDCGARPDRRRLGRSRLSEGRLTLGRDGGWDPDAVRALRGRAAPALRRPVALCRPVPGGTVVDLGCGSGELTAELHRALAGGPHRSGSTARRPCWPTRPDGRDARASPSPLGDLARRGTGRRVDLVFANASLHWVDDHPALLARLRAALAPGRPAGLPGAGQLRPPLAPCWRPEVAAEPPFAAALRRRRRRPGRRACCARRATPRSSTTLGAVEQRCA